MKSYQSSFFDESNRLAALSCLGDPLEQLSKYVDFEIFRPVLSAAFQKTFQTHDFPNFNQSIPSIRQYKITEFLK